MFNMNPAGIPGMPMNLAPGAGVLSPGMAMPQPPGLNPQGGLLPGAGVLNPEFAHLAGTEAIQPKPGFDMNTLAAIGNALASAQTAKQQKPMPATPGAPSLGFGQSINIQSLLPVGQALIPGMGG